MVKIFENNRKLIVTAILYIIYCCEVIAASNSSTDAAHNLNLAQVNSRRGQRRRRTTTEDKSYHPRKGHYVLHINDEKTVPKHEHHTTQKQHTSTNEDRIEKWSVESVDSTDSEDSAETTKIAIYIMDTTPKQMRTQENVRNHQIRHDRKSAGDAALNWLVDTVHGKLSQKSTTTTNKPSTKGEHEDKHNISAHTKDHHKRKTKTTNNPSKTSRPATTKSDEEGEITKRSKSGVKSNSEKEFKVLRAGGNYDTEREHGPSKHNFDTPRLQYVTTYDERPGHRGLVGSSEEYEARYQKSQSAKKKVKYLWNPETHHDRSEPKHRYTDNEKGHSDKKHYYYEDKKKHSDTKHRHVEDEKDHDSEKHSYNENKKKHKGSKYHQFEEERNEEIHKHHNFHEDRDHGGSKHHSNRIHNEMTYSNDSDNNVHEEMIKTKLEESNEIYSYGHPSRFEKERSTTHHEGKLHYDKIKDIRTGVMSLEDISSEIDDIVTTTKKVKQRKKPKYVQEENMPQINILRSTRMPSAYGLQEENPGEPEEPADEVQKEEKKDKKKPPVFNEDLNPYAMEAQMKRFAEEYTKTGVANVTVEVIGRTVEYNNIVLIKMTEIQNELSFRAKDDKYTDEKPEKKIVFIVHGLSVAGMKAILLDVKAFNSLMKIYRSHVNKFDIFVIPMANPDGYAATLNSRTGYWNKNLSPQSGCSGVVLDRNFDVAWNGSLKISSCSHMYPGPTPFSEAETRAVRDVFHQYSHKLIAYIHVHASTYDASVFKGDAILYPRGYSDAQTDDDKYIDLKGEVEEAMKNASFQVLSVTVDSLYSWYGMVSGTSVDYASTVYGIPYAMEFAMQIYDHLQRHAMTQIWGRLIPLVFKCIWKNINANPGDN